MNKKQIKILQELLMRCTEFKPLLTPKQYKVYTKHLKFALVSNAEGVKGK